MLRRKTCTRAPSLKLAPPQAKRVCPREPRCMQQDRLRMRTRGAHFVGGIVGQKSELRREIGLRELRACRPNESRNTCGMHFHGGRHRSCLVFATDYSKNAQFRGAILLPTIFTKQSPKKGGKIQGAESSEEKDERFVAVTMAMAIELECKAQQNKMMMKMTNICS